MGEHLCRVLDRMDNLGVPICVPQRPKGDVVTRPLLDFAASYVLRGIAQFPRQGSEQPCSLNQRFPWDCRGLRHAPVTDTALGFHHRASGMNAQAGAVAEGDR